MKKILAMIMAVAASAAAYCAVVPSVGTGTAPNQWTSNIEGVMKAAKTTGYPIFVLIINDSNAGEGCAHCATFLNRTINTAEFEALKESNKFYMVLMNYWSGANGYRTGIDTYHYRWYTNGSGIYATADMFPDICVVDPDGSKAQGWGVPWGDNGNRTSQIKAVLDRYNRRVSNFSLESSSSTVVTGGESWSGRVVRSGGSGLAGSATLALSGTNSGNYKVEPAYLDWGTADGNRDFAVSALTVPTETILFDEVFVTLNGVSAGADVAYGTQQVKLTFKDSRVKKTLPEFCAENYGLDGLAGEGSTWYVGKEDSAPVLQTLLGANVEGKLALNATVPGKLTICLDQPVDGSVTNSGSVSVLGNSAVLSNQTLTVGVSVGDRVEIAVRSSATNTLAVGFSQLKFEPLSLWLVTPSAGAVFGWPDLCADTSLVDFHWSSSAEAPDYTLYLTQSGFDNVFSGSSVAMGAETTTNGVAAGLVRTDIVMGDCQWGVKVADSSADIGVATTTQVASFAITAKPEFDVASQNVTGYLKCGTGFDFSARAPAGTGSLTYSAKKLPAGLSLDKQTGVVTGIPKRAGKYSFTVTAANAYGSAEKSVTLTVAKFPTAIKGNYNGIFFSGKTMPYSMTWKVGTTGKWTGKILKSDGKSLSVKGTVAFDENGLVTLESADISIRQVPGTALWAGVWNGVTMYGKKTAKLAAPYVGVWTAAAQAEPSVGAYATSKITSNGKVSISGKVLAKQKLSGKGQSLLLTGAEIAACVPEWDNGGKTGVFVHGAKKTTGRIFCGGFAYWQDGSCDGLFTFDGRLFVSVGSLWNKKQSLAALDGAVLEIQCDDGTDSYGVSATEKKLVLVPREGQVTAKISAKTTGGTVSGSYNKTKFKFAGVLYVDPNVGLTAFGGVTSSGQTGVFTIRK